MEIFENLAPSIARGENGGMLKLHKRNGRTVSLPEVNNKVPSAIKQMRDSKLFMVQIFLTVYLKLFVT